MPPEELRQQAEFVKQLMDAGLKDSTAREWKKIQMDTAAEVLKTPTYKSVVLDRTHLIVVHDEEWNWRAERILGWGLSDFSTVAIVVDTLRGDVRAAASAPGFVAIVHEDTPREDIQRIVEDVHKKKIAQALLEQQQIAKMEELRQQRFVSVKNMLGPQFSASMLADVITKFGPDMALKFVEEFARRSQGGGPSGGA